MKALAERRKRERESFDAEVFAKLGIGHVTANSLLLPLRIPQHRIGLVRAALCRLVRRGLVETFISANEHHRYVRLYQLKAK